MPNAPRRPCPVCGTLTTGGRCARHRRPSAAARGYDAEWAALARAWLTQYPWCGQRLGGVWHVEHSYCARRGEKVPARVVDHIQPLPDGPRLDLFNLQSLCVSCNRRKV
jgi:5-methylcytosine-specific restriction endonuclease McrA